MMTFACSLGGERPVEIEAFVIEIEAFVIRS
jgi:hypothetical protein